MLAVPGIGNQGHFELQGRNNSSKLFRPVDATLVDSIHGIASSLLKQREAREQGATLERKRITRDLHDDVGAKLLTLTIEAETEKDRQIARDSLQLLRETIQSLDDNRKVSLRDALADWRSEAMERIEVTQVELEWPLNELIREVVLEPRQRLNLGRIIREALSNIIKVPNCTSAMVKAELTQKHLMVMMSNNGVDTTKSLVEGTGFSTIRTRTNELDGQVNWELREPDQLALIISIPLD
ncbi:MAG: signal transduction histidine kinase [Parasphingorhabdus sp.]